MPKSRLDQLLVERQLAPSREKAQALIMSGQVLVNDSPAVKSGQMVDREVAIRIRGGQCKYVSRGGDKLEGALRDFGLSLTGVIALDVGASTGGFTDCMLQHGAVKVYAVDVGTNQLAHSLRMDARVSVFEQTHVKELASLGFEPPPSFAVTDLSFISVRKVLPFIVEALAPAAELLVLVKPQFELEPAAIEKGGVVRSERDRQRAISLVSDAAIAEGLTVIGVAPSHLQGAKSGNQEYFLYLKAEKQP